MNYDEQLQDATEHYLEQGMTEDAARRLARDAVADGEDAKAQDAWENAQ